MHLHVKAFLIYIGHPQAKDMIDSFFPEKTFEEKMDKVKEILNCGERWKKTKDISYAHIPDFVEGVLVHPMAPDWYVEVVGEFCKRNNLPFEGKSKLYVRLLF